MADETLISAESAEAQSRYCTPTNAGNELFASLVAEGAGIEFTKILVGSGQPDADADPAELTGLVNFVTYGTMTEPIQDGDKVNFTVEYRNDLNNGLAEGFWMDEFGVWARKAGETTGDVMVFYGCLGDYPQYVEAYDGTHVDSRRFPLSITVGNVTSATASFSTDAFVTSAEMAEYAMPKAGGSMTGDMSVEGDVTVTGEISAESATLTDTTKGLTLGTIGEAASLYTPSNPPVRGGMATNDYWQIYGEGDTEDSGSLIIESGDNGSEPIILRQTSLGAVKREATLLDGSGNTQFPGIITASDYAVSGDGTNALIARHNLRARYKVLTDSYSLSEILTMVSNRDYSDIWVGDIINVTVPAISATGWSAGTASFYVAEIESHSKYGDTKITKGHLCLVPVTQLGTAYMNSSDITTGAYTSSYMNQTVMPAVATALKSAFGSSHIIASREFLTIAVNTSANSKGVPTSTGATYWNSGSWSSCDCRLMSENEVYGNSPFSSSGEDDRSGLPAQLALFKADARTIVTGNWYWLSSVAHSPAFCYVGGYGRPHYNNASLVGGVRPRFLIG